MTHFGFVSTYPPTRCGLATFTQALAGELTAGRSDSATIVRVLDRPEPRDRDTLDRLPVAVDLLPGDAGSLRASVEALNACDVAIVQHEYGIYGGRDGNEAVTLLKALSVPVIVVLHTVLAAPTTHQRSVLQAVCEASASVVVMTDSAAAILLRGYGVAAAKVAVIPHGVPSLRAETAVRDSDRKRVLTWGLISAGKGLEWGIRAVGRLRDAGIPVEYVVSGQTHPKVLAHEGERYRHHLRGIIAELSLEDVVTLDDRYLDAAQLGALIATADLVLLPYVSQEQATSGVLSEAVAAGVPVVATPFPHAVELLSSGAGLLVGHSDPESMAAAMQRILTTTATADEMHEAALRESHLTTWPVVSQQYRRLAESIAAVKAA